MSNKKIYITVPHNSCIKGIRLCDLVAEKFADIFYDKLNDDNIIVYIFKSNINRKILDANRFMTNKLNIKDSNLWQNIKDVFQYGDNILFDIHSFPDKYREFHGKDIIILDNYPYQKFAIMLNEYLNKNNINSKILEASTGNNAILDIFSLHPLYTPTILLEVNEKYLNNDVKLNQIADILIKFIKSYNYIKKYKFIN